MLPESIENLAEILRSFPGVGKRSSQKLALDILHLDQEHFENFTKATQTVREKVKFCHNCGFFAEDELCNICQDSSRNKAQICVVENPTDIISVEKSNIYHGSYHVLDNLISPLENIFAENTNLPTLFTRIEKDLKNTTKNIELILFLKAGFESEATTAYLKEVIKQKKWKDKVNITRLAQGLPLYYNTDTLDQATMVKALEDRRNVN